MDSKLVFIVFILLVETHVEAQGIDLEGLSDLARAFGEMAGTAEECEFKCKLGEKPKPRPGHKPSSNGCGSYGIQISSDHVPGMDVCCDEHDFCYDACGSSKKDCDKDFRTCLDSVCTKMRGTDMQKHISSCRATSNLLFTGAVTLGCDPYLQAQKQACICSKQNSKQKQRKKQEL